MKKLHELVQKNCLVSCIFDLFKKNSFDNKNLPLITISREKGSGGRLIADLVERELGDPWKLYHKEIVEEIAKKSNLEKKLISEVDEGNISFANEMVSDFFGKRYLNLSTYYKHLVNVLSTISQRGNAIIIGRGANFLFPQAFKVRIICEMAQRIKWVSEFEKITREEAIKRINESDKKRNEFVKTLFYHSTIKAHHYDLILRTGDNLSIEDAAETIVFLVKRRFKL